MSVAFRSLHAVFVALALLLTSGPLASQAPAEPAVQASELDEHFRMHRWPQAAEGYRQIVEAEPQNAEAWFRLGYALHQMERYAEALVCHEQAAILPSSFQTVATYNAACARALRGEVDRALDWLQRAVDAGFREVELLDSDADLNSLRTDPRFKRLRAGLVSLDASCTALPYPPGNARQFDFLVGRWRSHNWTRTADGGWTEAGELLFDTRSVLGGEAIVTFAEGRVGKRDAHGLLLRRYDAEQDQWLTIVNWPEPQRSSFAALRGGFRLGRAEFFSRFRTGRQGETTQTRATLSDVCETRVRMESAVTTDAGRTWQTRMVYELERAPDSAPIEASRRVGDEPFAATPEFRTFDFLLGPWEGLRTAAACGTSTTVRVEAASILGGAALVVETTGTDPDAALGSYEVLGYEPGRQRWVRYAVERGVTGLVRQEGGLLDDGLCLTGKPGPGSGGSGCRLRWPETGPDRIVTVCERRAPGAEPWLTCWRQELRRAR